MNNFNMPRFVVAGASSDVGKTTFTIGLMAAYKKLGYNIQGFKVGPDYIDPSYHTAITGRVSRNLDTWMTSEDGMKEVFYRGSEGADLAIVEGVMGLFDGKDPLSNKNSTAEISMLLKAPVILIINASGIARSAAAIVLGYQKFCPDLNISGIIVNRVGSKKHFQLLKDVIEHECNIPVIGYLEKNIDIVMPARHLGLVPALERGELTPLFEKLANLFEETIDLDYLFNIANKSPKLQIPESTLFKSANNNTNSDIDTAVNINANIDTNANIETGTNASVIVNTHDDINNNTDVDLVNIAVAKDEAFNFYYPENIELLELAGAKIHYFSPLRDERLPNEIDALYIGGGYPEEFAGDLADNIELKEEIKEKINAGLPTFGECGGYMYLSETITDHEGKKHEMVGVIPAEVTMQRKLIALGYREATALENSFVLEKGEKVRGHEFHYSTIDPSVNDYSYAYEVNGLRGNCYDGYNSGNLLAGYTHVYFASNTKIVKRFIQKAKEYKMID